MNKETRRKQILFQVISLILPLLILVPVFLSMKVTPFGDSNLLVSDLGTQYVPFFAYFKEMIIGDGSPLYSFSSGMGDDFLPLAAYYLMSPFNVLFLVTPNAYLATSVTIVIMLKICFISGSLFFYLSQTYRKVEWAQLFFALAYAFCGFVGIYLYNIMWLDALIWLPILALSIHYLVEQNKKLFYCLSLFAVIVSNYYLGYMSCLFALCYFIYWTAKKTEFTTIKEYFKQTKVKWRNFIVYSVIGAGLSGFILVPAALGMLQTGKSAVDWHIFLPIPRFGLDFLVQLGLENTGFNSRLDHLPTIFVGSFVLILALSYFFIKTISRKEKWLSFSLIAIFFFSFWLQSFNTVWHMFQLAAGFPYRNTYMLSFVLIFLAYESWQKRSDLSNKTILKVTGSLVGLLAIGYGYSWLILPWLVKKSQFFKDLPFQSAVPLQLSLFFISVGIFLIMGLLLVWARNSKKRHWVLFLALFLELGFNFYNMLGETPLADETRFRSDMTNYNYLIDEMKAKDSDLFRIENAINGVDNGYNESFLYSYNSTPYYSSTLNENLRLSLARLGLFSRNERRISDVGQTPFLDYLFNTRYSLDEPNPEEAEFAIVKSDFGQIVPKNPSMATSIGYTVPLAFADVKLKDNQPFANQNALAESIYAFDQPLFEPAEVMQSIAPNSYFVTAKADGPLYLYLPNNRLEKIQVFVNHEKIVPRVNIKNQALLDLGDFKKGTQILLDFSSSKTIKMTGENVQTMNGSTYYQTIRTLEQNRLIVSDWKASKVEGKVNVQSDHELLFVSIPYDEKWKASVDGEKVKLQKVAGNFIGIPVSKGEHQIELNYSPEGFQIGSFISYGALAGLVSLSLVDWYQKRKRIKNRAN